MEIAAILGLVTQLVPVAKSLVDTLQGSAQKAPNPSALDIVASIAPVAAQLLATINTIKNQTEADYPEVWAAVSADYASASSEFDKLKAARGL